MKIAQFKSPEFERVTILEQIEAERIAKHCHYVRISEYVEVEFIPSRDPAAEIEALAKVRAEAERRHAARIKEIDARCSELVANGAA